MTTFNFDTVDVFTTQRFGGNPLAVFLDASGIDDVTMQALAAEMNLSETTFVLPAADAANTARVRILTVRDGQIAEVEVYFGWNVPHELPAGEHRDPE